MPTKYLIRFDDVCPTMNWTNFLIIKSQLEVLGIKSILGVVPECRDPTLQIEEPRDNFFDMVREWAKYGDTIAQHGTYHVYDTSRAGILAVNARSEFAGHDYATQFERIQHGKNILVTEGVWQPFFMAPGHSFDKTTIDVLNDLNFKVITDGYGFYPYTIGSIAMVPQLTSRPLNFGFGYSTLCLHVNSMSREQVDTFLQFVDANLVRFVDVKSVPIHQPDTIFAIICRFVTSVALRLFRYSRRLTF